MIEQLLKKRGETFCYGEVMAISAVDRKVQVRLGDSNIWLQTELDLDVGAAVILARRADSSKFIVQYSRKALPAEEVLLLI